ncbi:MAG: three-Cys-motif partner protein TcmP [Candidatus Lokiarchaeota archaeon]|nr:three-Cys-motif partner protein TcmP [Candidatus Lokiarchaeota archaeon]
MCEPIDIEEKQLIKIRKKTRKHKYKLLERYIPMWNKILIRKGVKRAIIDTHAGTGLVYDEKKKKKFEGSLLIFLRKTCLIKYNLSFYFIEKNSRNYEVLKRTLQKYRNKELRIPIKKPRREKIEEILGLVKNKIIRYRILN